MRLATDLHPVPTIRMSGAILPLPHKPSWLTKRQIYFYLQQCSLLELGCHFIYPSQLKYIISLFSWIVWIPQCTFMHIPCLLLQTIVSIYLRPPALFTFYSITLSLYHLILHRPPVNMCTACSNIIITWHFVCWVWGVCMFRSTNSDMCLKCINRLVLQ